MDYPKQTQESMAARVMRFEELKQKGIPIMFIDSMLPGPYANELRRHWRYRIRESRFQHSARDHRAASLSDRHGLGATRLRTRLAHT